MDMQIFLAISHATFWPESGQSDIDAVLKELELTQLVLSGESGHKLFIFSNERQINQDIRGCLEMPSSGQGDGRRPPRNDVE